MRAHQGVLTRIQRRWAWAGFLLLAINSPVVALVSTDDSWLLSLTVAAIVAFVILMDDVQRRRIAGKPPD